MKLSEIVSKGAVVASLRSPDRDGVIAELVDALVASGSVEARFRDELAARILDRERLGSTGFGRGVAVPHVKHKAVTRMAAAVGLSARGVDFNSLDKQPVYSVFLLLSPEDKPEEHLKAMEVIFKSLSKDSFRRQLRQATDAPEIRAILEQADDSQLSD